MKNAEVTNGFNQDAVIRAASLLSAGELVAFPTETVYGLGADVFNSLAVAKIFDLKKRPHFDPLIVHISRTEAVEGVSSHVPEKARVLMERFWPGPLTIILQKAPSVPDIVTAGLNTVGVRMPNHPVALDLINKFGGPIAAPSANPFGYMSTTRASDVARLFRDYPLLVLDGGSSSYGIESTIVSLSQRGTIVVHRHGSVSIEELKEVAGEVVDKKTFDHCEAPGELPYHYAPHTPLRIVAGPEEIATEDSGYLSFASPVGNVRSRIVKVLSPSGEMREAAANFFSFLIELDQETTQVIYTQKIAEKGLGRAMMERLRKAAQKAILVNH
jgi:L-threonylcarbamoyladenylate synthase